MIEFKNPVPIYRKGQVWLVKEPRAITKAKMKSHDRAYAKTRPYVIMTSNEALMDSVAMIQCLPITSSMHTIYPEDVVFINRFGEKNRISTSQIVSKDIAFFEKYLYSLSDEIMNYLDTETTKRLGTFYNLYNINTNMKEIRKNLDNLENVLGSILDRCEKPKEIIILPKEKEEVVEKKEEIKRKYHRWTDDEYLSLLRFLKNHTYKEAAEAFKIKPTSVASIKNRAAKRAAELNINI